MNLFQELRMRIIIDTETKNVKVESQTGEKNIDLFTKEAFELVSSLWVKIGWSQKYQYTFTWLGRPIIQLPEDMLRAQEIVYRLKPDIIIETGVAHGGSLFFWASLCKAINKGRVIGIDIEIRAHNRKAIEEHELFPWITLIEGSSTDAKIVQKVKSMINPGDTVLAILDSNHTKQHVLAELEAYHNIITPGSYIVATDGIMQDLYDVPRGKQEWIDDNPSAAAFEFSKIHKDFVIEKPAWVFNESQLDKNITHWPDAWLRRVK
jgi:cephalosporin hydroxylase